jgi:hypothetical protein
MASVPSDPWANKEPFYGLDFKFVNDVVSTAGVLQLPVR